jgi:uroporphyrinogen-III synthase
VVVTRSPGDNRSLVDKGTRRGWHMIEVPLIEVTGPADDGSALRRAAADLGRYRWVVVTSANGVDALHRAYGATTPWPEAVRLAAVGPTTAAAARSAGWPVDLVPEVATAAALVDAFPSPVDDVAARSVLAPLARLASSTVEDGLGAKGWLVHRVEAYDTRAPAETPAMADDLGSADAVCFFSPSAVDRFLDRFADRSAESAAQPEAEPPPASAADAPDVGRGTVRPPQWTAVAIGPATAARAAARGLTAVEVAQPHSEDGVVACLERLLGTAPPSGTGEPVDQST